MSIPTGIKHFSENFREFENDYAIIGGVAAAVLLGDAGLQFRSTKTIHRLHLRQ